MSSRLTHMDEAGKAGKTTAGTFERRGQAEKKQTTSNHSLSHDSHKSMGSGLTDIARIVLQQMQRNDGPCKYWLRHIETWRGDNMVVTATMISHMHAFLHHGELFFSVQRGCNGEQVCYSDANEAWTALIANRTDEQLVDIVSGDSIEVETSHLITSKVRRGHHLYWSSLDSFYGKRTGYTGNVFVNIYVNLCKHAAIRNPVPRRIPRESNPGTPLDSD